MLVLARILSVLGEGGADALAKPTILTVDDDPAVLQAITRDLRRQYGAEFQIVRAGSGAEALRVLTE
jgi:thioredoxin reductase (NADPH)